MHQTPLRSKSAAKHLTSSRIADIPFAQFLRIMAPLESSSRTSCLVLHPARREWRAARPEFMPAITGNEYFMLAARSQFHQPCPRRRSARCASRCGQGDWRALMNLDAQAIRHKAHHAGDSTQGICSSCWLALGQRDEKDVAPIPTHHFHDWAWGDVLGAATSIWSLDRRESATSAFRNGKRLKPESGQNCPKRPSATPDPKEAMRSSWGSDPGARKRAFGPRRNGIPAPLPDRRAERRRKLALGSLAFGCVTRKRIQALPGPRWNLISAPLFGVSCRQENRWSKKYYNLFFAI